MNVKEFDRGDYLEYASWLRARNRPVPEFEELPRFGITISFEGEKLISGFLVTTNTPGAVICNLASVLKHPKRSAAVDLLIDVLSDTAKTLGYKVVYMSTNLNGLVSRLLSKNFTISEENMTHLMRVL